LAMMEVSMTRFASEESWRAACAGAGRELAAL
jgi:hypothetical protein